MAITTLSGAVSGMQYVQQFVKYPSAMVAGRAHSFFNTNPFPRVPDNTRQYPDNLVITSSSVANPTVITCTGHGLTTGDQVSISGHTGSTPALDGQYTITNTGTNTFTIPVNVTVGGTGGVACCFNRGGSGTPGLKGEALTSIVGQFPFNNPVAGNTYISRIEASSTIVGTLLLCDRLWHNAGVSPVITTEQVFTNAAQIPARDATGANTGYGVYAGVEVINNLGNGTPTFTLKYTNTAGTAGKTSTNIFPTANTPTKGTFFQIGLATGDVGIQKAESLTLNSTYTSGSLGVTLYRPIARLELTTNGIPNAIDALTGGFPRVYDNSVPFLIWIPSSATQPVVSGHIIYSQG
jgi:hypothetical protein